MRRVWMLGVVVVLGLAVSCSGTGGGNPGDGGNNPPPDGGTDGGCTGPSCNSDGGTDGGQSASPLTATPDRIVIGTTPGAAKSAQLTLQNTSASTVSLQSVNVSGDGAGAFSISGATVPADVAAGASVTLAITFNGAAGVSQATLAAVTAGGTTNVPLGGLAIPASNEPSLQWIFDVHNIPVTAGNPDPSKKDFPASSSAGDEIAIQSFQKAGDGPVTLQLLASYGPNFEPVSINGWYVSGNTSSRTELFRIGQASAFSLDPPVENGGSTSFDPGSSAFGFWNEWPFWETVNQGIGQYVVYQEDALNTWDTGNNGHHHVRVYPYRNPDGSQDPHAYIVTTEEAPVAVGPDYNDVVYIVRNVVPAGSSGGALQFQNLDGEPSSDRMFFNVITTIAPCWGPLTVKDSGTLRVQNLSGSTVTVSSIDVTDAFTATPSTGLPAALAPGATLDVAVKFVATDGALHNGTLTVHSDDATAPAKTVNLAGFRQTIPQFPNEPQLDQVVNGLYGFTTVVGDPDQLKNAGGEVTTVGDEVLSAYWVKADSTQPVTLQLVSAWHSGWDCSNPNDKSYGSSAYWFAKGDPANPGKFILAGAVEDIQRLLPRYMDPDKNPGFAIGHFDPGSQQFGFHIELEFSDWTMAEQEPWCVDAGRICGHRMRFWPVKDENGSVVANTWLISLDMHQRASPGVPFFANYDYNDETYIVRNIMPAPQ